MLIANISIIRVLLSILSRDTDWSIKYLISIFSYICIELECLYKKLLYLKNFSVKMKTAKMEHREVEVGDMNHKGKQFS